MIRILKCDKDSYITNKIINSTRTVESRSTDANVGQAGTIDIYKLYNETSLLSGSSGIELTRGLLHFDLNPLRTVVSTSLDLNHSSFKCFLHLSDIYGGQTTPSNFTLNLYPLAKEFSEGRGSDVISYRDLDCVNWVTASLSASVLTPWSSVGCAASGALGSSNIDYYVSGVLNASSVSLGVTQNFSRGDEDLYVDITQIISGVMSNRIPDYGFRLSFNESEETDGTTRFVKRFASRHLRDQFKHPKIIVRYDDSFIDNQVNSYFDVTNSIAIYNSYFGQARNFYSGSTQITGSNCLVLQMVASKSVTTWTSSWSTTHSQSINHLTTSYSYFSMSFTGSQMALAGVPVTGTYYASVSIPITSPGLLNFMGSDSFVKFQPLWKSFDSTVLYSSGATLQMNAIVGSTTAIPERNFVVNIFNLKKAYNTNELGTFRVFIQDYDTDITSYQIPLEPKSEIYNNMHWRLLNAHTREVVVDFDTTYNSTRLSSDGRGMFFFMYFKDFPTNYDYELEFLIRENGNDYYVNNQGFRFKITE